MKHPRLSGAAILSALVLAIAPAMAWDPVSVLNSAVQGQVNQQIRRGVADVFRSIGTPSTESRPAGVDIRESRPGEVVIYTTPTCGYCTQARAHLKRRGIPYLEKDVSANTQARSEFQALGGRGVPLALFGTQKLTGFSAASYDNAWSRFQTEMAATRPPATAPAAPAAAPTAPAAALGAEGLAAGDLLIARIARVKLFAEPPPQGKVLGELGRQEEVIYLGETDGRYLRVKSADLEGWDDRSLLGTP